MSADRPWNGSRAPRRVRAAAVCLFALGISPALAERIVFRDLRVLEVTSVVLDGDQYVLSLGAGSEVRVLADAVLEVRESLPAPPEPALPPAAPTSVSWEKAAGSYMDQFRQAAVSNKLEPALVVAVALVESNLDPFALSPKGAQGVMQLMPETARVLSVADPFDAGQNIAGGSRWLRRMLDAFDGDLDLALAAYNAGEEAVRRHGGIPPFPETQRYVRLVREKIQRLTNPS
ncbi:MAG: lytic transglycosylase domain-containing protein [Acidobacteria bacterium]|nr:lytic transglycosylase domain-containing protein [Acidobacteriota bacterium]